MSKRSLIEIPNGSYRSEKQEYDMMKMKSNNMTPRNSLKHIYATSYSMLPSIIGILCLITTLTLVTLAIQVSRNPDAILQSQNPPSGTQYIRNFVALSQSQSRPKETQPIFAFSNTETLTTDSTSKEAPGESEDKPEEQISLDDDMTAPTPLPLPRAAATICAKTTATMCDYNATTNAGKLYRYYATYVQDHLGNYLGVNITIRFGDLCCIMSPEKPSSRAYFRIYTTGPTMTAVDPLVVMEPMQREIYAIVRVPEAGIHRVNVQLTLFDIDDKMMGADYSRRFIVPQTAAGKYFDIGLFQDSNYSPTLDFEIPSNLDQMAQYQRLQTLKPSTSLASINDHLLPLPACGLDRGSYGMHEGRWILGPRISNITRYQTRSNLFDEYNPIWAPFDCAYDHTLTLVDALQKIKWIQVVGDSNIRHLFYELCAQVNGTRYGAPKDMRHWDPPKLCLAGTPEKPIAITYNNWFYGKPWNMFPDLTFRESCARYNVDPRLTNNTYYGQPNCSLASDTIQDMEGPGLTYFSWGSHHAEYGVNNHTRNLLKGFYSHPFFQKFQTVWALTTAVDPTIIPARFGKHQIYRNNERITGVNNLQVDVLKELLSILPVNRPGSEPGFFPILDVFHLTHASNERFHSDAVHMYHDIQKHITRQIVHYIHYAPQFQSHTGDILQQ